MAYTVHTTEGFILSSSPVGEANKVFHIFTHDFGLILAIAQGVRLNKSKLQPHLVDYNFSNISLVKGKEFWRITSAQTLDKNKDKKYIQILATLKRLFQGEGEHKELFDYLKDNLFKEIDDVKVMLKILSDLGYINEREINDKNKIELINKGLKESQL